LRGVAFVDQVETGGICIAAREMGSTATVAGAIAPTGVVDRRIATVVFVEAGAKIFASEMIGAGTIANLAGARFEPSNGNTRRLSKAEAGIGLTVAAANLVAVGWIAGEWTIDTPSIFGTREHRTLTKLGGHAIAVTVAQLRTLAGRMTRDGCPLHQSLASRFVGFAVAAANF
jgi:hypothetical protein